LDYARDCLQAVKHSPLMRQTRVSSRIC